MAKKTKKQAKKWTVYTYKQTVKTVLTLTDKELKKLKTKSKNNNFLTVEDYLITILKYDNEYIEANQLLGYNNRYDKINKKEDIIEYKELTNPKLITSKNNILKANQTVLEDYKKFYMNE